MVYGAYQGESGDTTSAEVRKSGLPNYGLAFFEGKEDVALINGLAPSNPTKQVH